MPFPYYANLSAAKKRVYRRSDAIDHIPVKTPRKAHPISRKLKAALESNTRKDVAAQASDICRFVCAGLDIQAPAVKIKSRRPSSSSSDLHGLYELEEGERPLITVWMKTAAKKQVVAFKSFIRTVLHELCHHVDYLYFELDDSLHTEGFFKREARLYRDLVPASLQKESGRLKKGPASAKKPTPKKARRKKPEQMELL